MLYHSKNYGENICYILYIIAKITERMPCYIIAKITERIHVLL